MIILLELIQSLMFIAIFVIWQSRFVETLAFWIFLLWTRKAGISVPLFRGQSSQVIQRFCPLQDSPANPWPIHNCGRPEANHTQCHGEIQPFPFTEKFFRLILNHKDTPIFRTIHLVMDGLNIITINVPIDFGQLLQMIASTIHPRATISKFSQSCWNCSRILHYIASQALISNFIILHVLFSFTVYVSLYFPTIITQNNVSGILLRLFKEINITRLLCFKDIFASPKIIPECP